MPHLLRQVTSILTGIQRAYKRQAFCYNWSMNLYESIGSAKEYLAFLASTNGKIQQTVLLEAIQKKLSPETTQYILDAACGSGWLSENLSHHYPNISGFDSSETLIEYAHNHFPKIKYQVADIAQPLPFEKALFDTIILNIAATDLAKPIESFTNLNTVLKPGGQLLVTIPNPYYAYPVGVWKRGLIDRLLFRKPKLRLRSFPYNSKELLPSWDPKQPTSHYYSLTDHINTIKNTGFNLCDLVEIKSETDSKNFDLRYQLFRYPLFLLLEFKKAL